MTAMSKEYMREYYRRNADKYAERNKKRKKYYFVLRIDGREYVFDKRDDILQLLSKIHKTEITEKMIKLS